MSHASQRNPKLLVCALVFSPALLVLHACGDKNDESATSAPKLPPPSRTDRSRTAPDPSATARAPRVPIDPQAALQVLTPFNALEVRTRLLASPTEWANRISQFYSEWGKLDPEAALLAASGEGRKSIAATLGVLEGWTSQDPRSARDWVSRQEPESLQTRYASSLIKAWPAKDLGALANWAEEHPALLTQVAVKWSASAPRETAQWLGSVTAGPQSQRATETLFRTWSADDPGAAGDYLIATPGLPHRDHAIAAYATTVIRDNPTAAAQWAREITDPGLRESILAALPKIQPLQVTTPLP